MTLRETVRRRLSKIFTPKPGCSHADSSMNGMRSSDEATSPPLPSAATAVLDPSMYDDAKALFAHNTVSQWCERDEARLLAPYKYLLDNPGQNFRSLLIQTLDVWLRCPREKVAMIDKAVTMAHTSSLMIDDIEDASDLRRGKPASHIVHGVPMTINSANYVYFQIFDEARKMSDLRVPGHVPLQSGDEVQQMLVAEMLNLHRGQGMELFWRDNFVCPTELEYVAMVNNKTAGLFRILLKLMISQSTTLKSVAEGAQIEPFLNLAGLLFQIRDDYLNLRSGDYAQNKGYCEDLTEGKFSFPIIHALWTSKAFDDRPSEKSSFNYTSNASGPLTFSTEENVRTSSDASLRHIQSFEELRRQRASHNNPFRRFGRQASPTSTSTALPSSATSTRADNAAAATVVVVDTHADLVDVIRNRPNDAMRKRAIVTFMETKTNSFRYTCEVLLRLDVQIREELTRLESILDDGRPNQVLRLFIEKLRKGWYQSSDCPVKG